MRSLKRSGIDAVIVFVCVLAAGCLQGQQSPAGKPNTVAGDEYAVYAAALDDVVGGTSYVVLDPTSIQGKPENIERALNFPIKDADRITDDLVNDFKAKNQKPHPIGQYFPDHERDETSRAENAGVCGGRLGARRSSALP